MEKVNFKTYDEIVQYLDSIEVKYNQENKDLNDITIGVFELKGKKTKEDQKKELRSRLISYVKTYEYYDRFLRDATTFRTKDFVRFLADYFSVVYGKKYIVQNNVSDGKRINSYDLIISESDLFRYSGESKTMETIDFRKLFDSCSDCCLLLADSLKFTLLDGINLSSDFEDFPELIGAAKAMVELKLTNPEMSDQRRLMSILSSTCLEFKISHDDSGQKLGKNYPRN